MSDYSLFTCLTSFMILCIIVIPLNHQFSELMPWLFNFCFISLTTLVLIFFLRWSGQIWIGCNGDGTWPVLGRHSPFCRVLVSPAGGQRQWDWVCCKILCATGPADKQTKETTTGPSAKTVQKSQEAPIILLSIDSVKDKEWWKAFIWWGLFDLIRAFILPAEKEKKKKTFLMCLL